MDLVEKLKLILRAISENRNAATYLPDNEKIEEINGEPHLSKLISIGAIQKKPNTTKDNRYPNTHYTTVPLFDFDKYLEPLKPIQKMEFTKEECDVLNKILKFEISMPDDKDHFIRQLAISEEAYQDYINDICIFTDSNGRTLCTSEKFTDNTYQIIQIDEYANRFLAKGGFRPKFQQSTPALIDNSKHQHFHGDASNILAIQSEDSSKSKYIPRQNSNIPRNKNKIELILKIIAVLMTAAGIYIAYLAYKKQ